MSTTQKKSLLKYAKRLCIYCLEPTTEQQVKATMAQNGITISEAMRYQLEHRRVDIHFMEFSLDDAMWLLSGVRKEIQLLEINIAQIKKKFAQMNIMHANGYLIDNQLFDKPKIRMDDKIKKIFDIISKLSYLWLPK